MTSLFPATRAAGEPAIISQPQSVSVSAGQTATLNAVVTGDNPMYFQWYRVNPGEAVHGSTAIPGATNPTYVTDPLFVTARYWLLVRNDSGTIVTNTVTVTVTATATSPPVITRNPQNILIDSGQTTTLSVIATGTNPLSYQWHQAVSGGSIEVAGATGTSFATPPLTVTTTYFCRVTNPYGTTNSGNATVQIRPFVALVPTVTQQPQSQTINAGQSATLTVAATGAQPLSYQWYQVNRGEAVVGSTPITGATGTTYTTPALNSTLQYWVRVINDEGAATSNTATITVTPTSTSPPVITDQPHGTMIDAGQTATLSVTASGMGTLTYQWFRVENGSGGSIGGATQASYMTPGLTTTTKYFVRVTNAFGTTESGQATVEIRPVVNLAPTITGQPQNQTITAGQTATLSVTATGTPTLAYQWFQVAGNGTTGVQGAVAATFTTPVLVTTASYFVRVSNQYGTADSVTVTVTVNQPSTANNAQFLAQSVPAQMAVGQPYSVAVQMKNTGTSTWTTTGSNRFFLGSQNPQDNTTWGYAWQALPGPVAPGEWAIVTFTVTAPATPGTYNFQWRMVQEAVGWFGETTPNMAVTVGSVQPLGPIIGKQPEVQTVAAGQTAKLGVVASGSGMLSYQWFQVTASGNAPISGATGATFITPPVNASTGYFVQITNPVGSVASLVANVFL